jgi:uncharacterized protein (TIGR03435 family)
MLWGAVSAQPQFEVASIKAHDGPVTISGTSFSGSRVTEAAVTLIDLVTDAYGLRYDQVAAGPTWAKSDRFDIAAKAPGDGPVNLELMRPMLQSLLADRFQMKVHREMREVPVYELVVGKNGPKLKESAPDTKSNYRVRSSGTGMHMVVNKGAMDQLARQLSNTAGRPVINKTALNGTYDYTLDWMPADSAPSPDSNVVSIFTAVQEQLGLKLEPAKGPVDTLVIDRAEKPSEN